MSNNIAGVVEAWVANKRAGAAEVCGTRAREAALLNCVHQRRACQRIAALVAMVHNDFWRLELK